MKQIRKRTVRLILTLCIMCSAFILYKSDVNAAYDNPYYIVVNKGTCVTTIYKTSTGEAIKACICSPGENTPEGTFYTPAKYVWHPLIGNVYGQYCTRITNTGVLFHSVYYYTNGDKSTICTREYNYLGVKRSLGCVRLTVADAKWVYDNCPLGTKVIVINGTSANDPLGKPDFVRVDDSVRTSWDPTDPDPANPYNNYKATITVSSSKSRTIEYGSKFNVKSGVTAADYDGTNITSSIKVSGSVNTKKLGSYKITYRVTSILGKTAAKTVTYKVVDTKKPTLTVPKNRSEEYLTTINLKNGAVAKAATGKTLTSKIKITVKGPAGKKVSITNGKLKLAKVGTYKVTYTVTGTNKKSAAKTIKIKSVDKRVKLTQTVKEIEYGSTFVARNLVKLTNYQGKTLKKTNITYSGNVNTLKLGTYYVKYTASEKNMYSRRITKTLKFKVVNKKAPVITKISTDSGSSTVKTIAVSSNPGDVYNVLNGVKAAAATGYDLTQSLKVDATAISVDLTPDETYTVLDESGNLDITHKGQYKITYSVTIPVTKGKTTSKTITINVK